MIMGKQYTSVAELVRDMAPDAETRDAAEKRIAGRKLVKHLMARRAVKGLSQQEVAQKLDCTQSRISKLETSRDDDIRIGDISNYAKAVDCEFVYGLTPHDLKPTDRVKGLVFAIKRHMDDLALLAKTDTEIASGVGRFFFELFVNFANLIGESARSLPLRPDQSPYFDVKIGPVEFETLDIETTCMNDDNMFAVTAP
jgi:transcriptional regulator with XRE-family HTH domain